MLGRQAHAYFKLGGAAPDFFYHGGHFNGLGARPNNGKNFYHNQLNNLFSLGREVAEASAL